MKKLVVLFSVLALVMVLAGSALAANKYLVATAEGQDVIVPQDDINNIPTYKDGDAVVAVMHSLEGKDKYQEMKRVGSNWVAYGAKGLRFHPAKIVDGKPLWAMLEKRYDLNKPPIDNSLGLPCFLVK
ncbi:MAG: hypothetical protein ABIB72_00665 [Candidatus Falkowbacteria bacterium]